MRRAFSMITAIFIIIVMATVASFVMNLSGKMVKSTTLQFQREQSVLLSKSYTEYAIMAVTANDHTGANCLNTITGTYSIYNINVDISYIGDTTNLGTSSCTNILSSAVDTLESPLNIIVDVAVSYTNLDHPDGQTLTYHKRTLQKI